ncbi:MAG TPA: glycosyl hydrolase [Cytophagaceae bacterium]|jgi:hypothetical protein
MKRIFFTHIIVLLVIIYSNAQTLSQEQQFLDPPSKSRPGAWWRWIGGCVSEEGIKRDMKEMADKGIRHIEHFDISGPCHCDTVIFDQKWMKNFKLSLDEAAKYGIEFNKVPSAGWGTGNPFIQKENGAKKIAYSEVQVEGGTKKIKLELPEITENYFKPIAILAFPEPIDKPVTPKKVTSSSAERPGYFQEAFSAQNVCDFDPNTYWTSSKINGEFSSQSIEFEFKESYTFNSLYLHPVLKKGNSSILLKGVIQKKISGNQYVDLNTFEIKANTPSILKFPETKGSIFRVNITSGFNQNIILGEAWLLRNSDKPYIRNGIKWWVVKSGTQGVWDYPGISEGGNAVLYDEYKDDGRCDVRSSEIVDLTDRVDKEGTLLWNFPPGRWTVIYFGEVLVGEKSRQADHLSNPGYEGDPFNPKTMDLIFEKVVDPMLKTAGHHAGKALHGLLIDSYEIGALLGTYQPTWTNNFRQTFKERNGYDLVKYLPAMAHRIVDSREITDRYFKDHTSTLSNLYNEFYARYTELAHQRGLKTTAQCGFGTMPHHHINGLTAFGKVDTPEAEFWADNTMDSKDYFCDPVRTAASAANIYGKEVVTAESFTAFGGWKDAPSAYKLKADQAFCDGVNHMNFAQFSHQFDTTAKPGLSTWEAINENMTWWNYSNSFLDYLARVSFVLQKGKHKADFAYFVGEGTLKFVPGKEYLKPHLPASFDFDGINDEVLLSSARVENGRLVLSSGMTYQYLVLPWYPNWEVSNRVLLRLKQFAAEGLTIVGNPPHSSIGLKDYKKNDQEIKKIVSQLWGEKTQPSGEKRIGKGRIVWGTSIEDLTLKDKFEGDVVLDSLTNFHSIQWIHRSDKNGEFYFLSNQSPSQSSSGKINFKIKNKKPELWNPVTGEIFSLENYISSKSSITIPISFLPGQSWIVVFKDSSSANAIFSENKSKIRELSSDWNVQFDDKYTGAESKFMMKQLQSWNSFADPDIKNFSGTATYTKTITISESEINRMQNKIVLLDLGIVKDIAKVTVNDTALPSLWTQPFSTNISSLLVQGHNTVKIEVANTWLNRIVWEYRLPAIERKISSNEYPFYNSSPQESGLLGPVKILVQE